MEKEKNDVNIEEVEAKVSKKTVSDGADAIEEIEVPIVEDFESLTKDELVLRVKELIETNKGLNVKLEEEVKKSLSYKDSWFRTAADFENFKKRNQDTRINAYKEGKIDAIKSLLVVGDNLDRALLLELDAKTKEGLELTNRRYIEILESMGVTQINPVGEDFNPDAMEAILASPKEEGETSGKVKQVFLKGYKLLDKVIRYAQVVVVE